MKVVVTGGLGFIGSNLVEYLYAKKDINIIIFDKKTYAASPEFEEHVKKKMHDRVSIIEDDINNALNYIDILKDAQFVFHLAAETHVGKSNYQRKLFLDSNVNGTEALLYALKGSSARVIVVSSAEVFGSLQSEKKPFTENSPQNPQSLYAVSKCFAEDLSYCYKFLYGVDVLVARLFNNYGPRQHKEKVIPNFITNALMNKPLLIEGDGLASRDWIHVSDTCECLWRLACLKNAKNFIINVASAEEVSLIKIAELVQKTVNPYNKKIEFTTPREGNVQRHHADNTALRLLIDVHFKKSFEDHLKELIIWHKENPSL